MNLRPQKGAAGTQRWGDAEKNMVNIRHFRELRVYQNANEVAHIESGGEFILYQTEDVLIRIEIRMQEEIW